MMKGLPPFYDQDNERMLEKIRYKRLQFPPGMSRPAKNLLSGLLTRDPETRLGSGPTDAEEIKVHDFFSVIDWEELATGNMSPPWMPPVHGAADTSQFGKEFTTMPISSPSSPQVRKTLQQRRSCRRISSLLTGHINASLIAVPAWNDAGASLSGILIHKPNVL
jgi:serine/threonine protein kinase